MKIKLVVIDLELTRQQRNLGAGALVAAIALAASVALADVPKVFAAQETLKAADLNANFAAHEAGLDLHEARLAALEGQKSWVRVTRNVAFDVQNNTFTTVPYNNVQADELAEYDAVLHRYTASIAGAYVVCSGVWSEGVFPAGNGAEIDLFVNDTRYQAISWVHLAFAPMQGCGMLRLGAGDVVDVRVVQTSGAAATYAGSDQSLQWLEISRL